VHRGTRLASCWAVCLALVLGSLMPLLAAAADLKGKPITEICEVYGVALPAPRDAHADPHAHHRSHDHGANPHPEFPLPQDPPGPSHSSPKYNADHCPLTANPGDPAHDRAPAPARAHRRAGARSTVRALVRPSVPVRLAAARSRPGPRAGWVSGASALPASA
jgi:hypothetical protein